MIPEHIWKSGVAGKFGIRRWIVFLALVDIAGEIDVDEDGELVELKEVSVRELSVMTGLGVDEVRRVMKWLRNKGVVTYYEPESDEENMLVRICGIKGFIPDLNGLRKRFKGYLKYVDGQGGDKEVERSEVDEVMDIYLGFMGGTYRSDPLTIMKLQEMARRFSIHLIREGFEQAKRKGIKSLDLVWVFCEEQEKRRKKNARRGRKER